MLVRGTLVCDNFLASEKTLKDVNIEGPCCLNPTTTKINDLSYIEIEEHAIGKPSPLLPNLKMPPHTPNGYLGPRAGNGT